MADPAAFLDLLARAELRSAAGDWAEAAGLWARVTEATVDAVPGRFRWDRHPPGWIRLTDTVTERPPPLHLPGR